MADVNNSQLVIEGDQDIQRELSLGSRDEGLPGVIGTASRVVNAILAVCEAAPGIRTYFDLPPITGRFAVRLSRARKNA